MAQLLLQVEGEVTPLDFNDETKYFLNHTSALPPTPVFERHTAPRRGADGEMLVRSTQIATELRFEVRCRGATYQETLSNLSEILTRLRAAEAYAKPARVGSPVRFIRQLGDQAEPQVYDVEYGDFFRKDEALESVNYISGELYLRCSPIPHALTFTEQCEYGLCNYDPWVIEVGGSEPVQARISVTPHGDADHYDFIRAAALDSRTRDVENFLWPLYLGLDTPPTGYTVELGGAGRVGGVRVHVLAKGTGQYQLRWRTGGGDSFNAGALTTLTDGAAYQEHIHEVSSNPATELPWTEADLNAGQWGVQKVGATEVRITQLYLAPLYVERDQLTEVITTRLADGAGAADAWTKTGAATAWDAVNDAVGANDGDTTYLSSTTDGQETFVAFQDYAGPTGLDVGVRATVQGTGGFLNGALEEPYSGPAFGSTLVTDAIPDTTGWTFYDRNTGTGMGYNGTHSALQITPDASGNPNGQGFAARSYGGLTPGVPVRLQIDCRTLTGSPPGSGCWVALQDGSNMNVALRQHTASFTTVYLDFVPMSEQVLIYLGVEGVFSATLYKNLLIREVASSADGWAAVGTAKGHQEVPFVGWYPQSVTERQVDGDSSQGVGEGDTDNYVGQTLSTIDGETYRVVANIQARGYANSAYQATPPFSFEVESGANQEVLTTTNDLDFDRVEITQVADGDSMTLKAYGASGAGGFLDGVVVQHLAEETDSGAVAFRVTIDANVVDHYGTYQLWARMKASGGPIGVIVRSGGDDGQLVASSMVTVEESDGVRTGRIGAVVIPATPTDPSAPITSFTFSVIVEPVSSSSDPVHLDLDCLELWPAGNQIIARNAVGKGPAPDEVQVFDPASGTVYVASGAGNTLRTTTSVEGGYVTLYPGENLILVRVSRTEIDDQLCPDDEFDVCIRYAEGGILGQAPPAFTPGDLIANFDYWFRSYDVAGANGANLDTWPDLSGNGRNATWPGSGNHPLILDGGLGSLRVVRMNGGKYGWSEISLPEAQIFLVAKVTATTSQGTMLRTSAGAGPNYGLGFQESFGSFRLYGHMYSSGNSGAFKRQENVNAVMGAWHLFVLDATYADTALALSRDGTNLTIEANASNLSGGSGITPEGSQCTMDIGQLIIAHGLAAPEVDELVEYLLNEAGL
jgi:hypothetical protein